MDLFTQLACCFTFGLEGLFAAVKHDLKEICFSLTCFLVIINPIVWLTGCFVYNACVFASCPFNEALILLTLRILTINTYLLKTFLSPRGSMPGICTEVQQQINLPVTSRGKEDNRLWLKCCKNPSIALWIWIWALVTCRFGMKRFLAHLLLKSFHLAMINLITTNPHNSDWSYSRH